ncbi:MAG: DivIVA domain-containing protein [Rothia sp. (in: high G+C Gram-positive bacteria)]|nr:DivIVA domain-containing protein [Rothia sp. (in: high G+C Gram-positive bacteria)]
MALTPEEVINKRFQPTKFKEGYNPEEVDDFLDEIVIELRRLNAENTSLKRQLEEAEAKISLAPEPQEEPAKPAAAPQPEPVPAPVAGSSTPSTTSATGLLAMAQKVHDDYVLEGKKERERLITEGKTKATTLVANAQAKSTQVLGELEKSKGQLEASVSQLRTFEKEYRTSLRAYITGQLSELESAPNLEPQTKSQ